MDLSKIDLSAVTVKPGSITTELQALQQSHGAARWVMILGGLAAIASQVAGAFHAIPDLSAQIASVAGFLTSAAGLLANVSATSTYTNGRVAVKTMASQAQASVADAEAKVAVAVEENRDAEIALEPKITTGVRRFTPNVPTIGLLLAASLGLSGCMSDQQRQDVHDSAQTTRNICGVFPRLTPEQQVGALDRIQKIQDAIGISVGMPLDPVQSQLPPVAAPTPIKATP